MGTKNNPSRYECYAKAEGDEPLFTLLGRDPMGSDLVQMWGFLRAQDERGARKLFEHMLHRSCLVTPRQDDAAKIAEANHCAADMWKFYKARRERRQ